jgi:hypothetical protein
VGPLDGILPALACSSTRVEISEAMTSQLPWFRLSARVMARL